MIETQEEIKRQQHEARKLDKNLIGNRRGGQVQRNISLIEGVNRSPKYVERLAGIRPDVPIKSATERYVQWFGATAMENPQLSAQVVAFWKPIFDFQPFRKIYRQREFWTIENETDVLFSQMRMSVINGDDMQTRFMLTQIRKNIDEMLEVVGSQRMQIV